MCTISFEIIRKIHHKHYITLLMFKNNNHGNDDKSSLEHMTMAVLRGKKIYNL